QTSIGHLVGERVLERQFEIGKQTGLVQKLGKLKSGEGGAERLLGNIGNGPEERQRHILSDDGGGLEKVLVLGDKPVDPRRKDRLRGGRDLKRRWGRRRVVRTSPSSERAYLDQRANALLEKERVALSSLDDKRLEHGQ